MFQIAVCDDEKIFVDQISEIVKAFFQGAQAGMSGG